LKCLDRYSKVRCGLSGIFEQADLTAKFLSEGIDLIGWKPRSECKTPDGGYNSESDLEFFSDSPDSWTMVNPGAFAVYFPQDAHAPLAGEGPVRKVVVKIAAA
jgi:biofilm protein TabA